MSAAIQEHGGAPQYDEAKMLAAGVGVAIQPCDQPPYCYLCYFSGQRQGFFHCLRVSVPEKKCYQISPWRDDKNEIRV